MVEQVPWLSNFWLEVFWLMTAMGTNKLVERGDKTEIVDLLWFYELGLSPAGLAKGFLFGSWLKMI